MNPNKFQIQLTTKLEKLKVGFINFVDISFLSEKQNLGFPTAIVFGKVLSKEYLKFRHKDKSYKELLETDEATQDTDEFYSLEDTLDEIADKIQDFIITNGFEAFSQSLVNVKKSGKYDTVNKIAPLPHKTIARLAGIGWIGKNSMLTTKDYGSAVIISSVLTNAPLKTSNQEDIKSLCGDCNVCKDNCKVHAIYGKNWEQGTERDKIMDVFVCDKCFQCLVVCPWTKRYYSKD